MQHSELKHLILSMARDRRVCGGRLSYCFCPVLAGPGFNGFLFQAIATISESIYLVTSVGYDAICPFHALKIAYIRNMNAYHIFMPPQWWIESGLT